MDEIVISKYMVSIIIPAYNEEQMIENTVMEISSIMRSICSIFEIVVVDDGSNDRTWEILTELYEKCPDINLKGVSFSRNFGKEAAIVAGISYSSGNVVITIDADLQHPPAVIPEMIEKWEQGNKIVEGRKRSRGSESTIHRMLSNLFYWVISQAIGNDIKNSSDFKLLDREIADIILKMNEKHLFYRAISSWLGFKSDVVYFDVKERGRGETKWSRMGLIKYALRNITSFSTKPLQIISVSGFIYLVLTIVLGLVTLMKYINGGGGRRTYDNYSARIDIGQFFNVKCWATGILFSKGL